MDAYDSDGNNTLTLQELCQGAPRPGARGMSVPDMFISSNDGQWYTIHEDYVLQVIDDHDGESWATVRGIELVDVDEDDDDDEPFWIISLTDDDCMSRTVNHDPLTWRIFRRVRF